VAQGQLVHRRRRQQVHELVHRVANCSSYRNRQENRKTGATLYNLTLYDQNKAVATGTGFSGGNGMPAIKDGNYMIRLDIRDPNGPNTINPNSALNNPPPFFGIQKMHDITDSQGTWDVVGAYGPIRARLNPMSGKDDGDYFHGQSNGHGYTHGCLCYGMNTSSWTTCGTTCHTPRYQRL
jgi:hypothetical protein